MRFGLREICGPRSRPRSPGTKVLAGMLATIGVLLGAGIWIDQTWFGNNVSGGAGGEVQVAPWMVHLADPRYAQERAELLRTLPAQIAALPPESQGAVMSSLK